MACTIEELEHTIRGHLQSAIDCINRVSTAVTCLRNVHPQRLSNSNWTTAESQDLLRVRLLLWRITTVSTWSEAWNNIVRTVQEYHEDIDVEDFADASEL